MRFSRLVSACGIAACVLSAAGGQEPSEQKREPIPGTFRSYIVLDQRSAPPKDSASPDPQPPQGTRKSAGAAEGKRNVTGFQHDLVVENNLNPTVLVFSPALPTGADDPLAKLTDRLMDLSRTFGPVEFGGYVVFPVLDKPYADPTAVTAKLVDEVVKPSGQAPQVTDALGQWGSQLGADWVKRNTPADLPADAPPLRSQLVIGLCAKDSPQVKAWNVADTGVTVVFFHRHKVVRRWNPTAEGVTDQLLTELTAEVTKELKK